jgi:pSer/pThr/pTyr-binding forkhead associated (FHA) protein
MALKKFSITFMSGPRDGDMAEFEQPLLGGEAIVNIGRREGCEIYLQYDNQVSRLHARLGCSSAAVTASESVTEPYLLSFWLEDASSRNGTFIEQDKNMIKGRVTLRPGSLFKIGRTWMRLDVPMSL